MRDWRRERCEARRSVPRSVVCRIVCDGHGRALPSRKRWRGVASNTLATWRRGAEVVHLPGKFIALSILERSSEAVRDVALRAGEIGGDAINGMFGRELRGVERHYMVVKSNIVSCMCKIYFKECRL